VLDRVVQEPDAIAIGVEEAREPPDARHRLRRTFEAHALLLEIAPCVLDALDLDDETCRPGSSKRLSVAELSPTPKPTPF
jgi:hypothetical protein